MSLTNEIANLALASNRLTDEVIDWMGKVNTHNINTNGRLDALSAQVERNFHDWNVPDAVVLRVGPGEQFPTLQDAWNSLSGKKLKHNVTIQLVDGEHRYVAVYLSNQPDAHRIRIIGNVDNPAACVIRWVPDDNGHSHGFSAVGIQGLTLGGFKLIGETTDKNWTRCHLSVNNQSNVNILDGSMMVEGGYRGFEIGEYSKLLANNIKFDRVCGDWAVMVYSGGAAFLHGLEINGPGKGHLVHPPASTGLGTTGREVNGILIQDNSLAFMHGPQINDVRIAIQVVRGSYSWCNAVRISNVAYGFLVCWGGTMWTSLQGDKSSTISHSEYAYSVQHGGIIYATDAIADDCDVAFHASTHGYIYAPNSSAKNCRVGYEAYRLSTINAADTKKNIVKCQINYSPATGSGNDGSYVDFS